MATSYIETWKGIAFALGRSERWCRYMARRGEDPLPVFKIGGIVRLDLSELDDWLARQRDRSSVVVLAQVAASPAPSGKMRSMHRNPAY